MIFRNNAIKVVVVIIVIVQLLCFGAIDGFATSNNEIMSENEMLVSLDDITTDSISTNESFKVSFDSFDVNEYYYIAEGRASIFILSMEVFL